jgi:hypothetical protein
MLNLSDITLDWPALPKPAIVNIYREYDIEDLGTVINYPVFYLVPRDH